jgi:hypothetical protein
MSLIHYVRPFLDLGICKEYGMARKTTGTTPTNRTKKTDVAVVPASVQAAPELKQAVRKNGEPANQVPDNLVPINLEEEIRRRAYELYLQRRASGGENGNAGQDWLLAEDEILSRQSDQEKRTA